MPDIPNNWHLIEMVKWRQRNDEFDPKLNSFGKGVNSINLQGYIQRISREIYEILNFVHDINGQMPWKKNSTIYIFWHNKLRYKVCGF